MEAHALDPDNAFWRFSVAVYAVPDVAPACLALQDGFGIDVNLALFCAWMGAVRGVALDGPDLAMAAATVRDWHETVVTSLRRARRGMKAMPAMREPAVAALRQRVAEVELEAEQVQQAMLFHLAEACWPAGTPAAGLAAANLWLLLSWAGVPDDAARPANLLAAAAEAQALGPC